MLNYLKSSKILPYEIMIFTELDPLSEFLADNESEVIMVNNEELAQYMGNTSKNKVVYLSEEQVEKKEGNYKTIFKYQACGILVRELVGYCMGNTEVINGGKHIEGNTKILGIYSPVARSYKTTLALAISQVLGKDSRVLYINLEEYSGLRKNLLAGDGDGLSEIMYWFRQNQSNLRNKISDVTKKIGSFYYIPPVECPDDVIEVITQEWICLMEFIASKCDYDYIVVDIGNAIRKPWEFFGLTNKIYLPLIDDEIGREKINEFMCSMQDMGRGKMLENIVTLDVPFDESMKLGIGDIEKLQWSLIGKFARKVLNE